MLCTFRLQRRHLSQRLYHQSVLIPRCGSHSSCSAEFDPGPASHQAKSALLSQLFPDNEPEWPTVKQIWRSYNQDLDLPAPLYKPSNLCGSGYFFVQPGAGRGTNDRKRTIATPLLSITRSSAASCVPIRGTAILCDIPLFKSFHKLATRRQFMRKRSMKRKSLIFVN